MRVFKGLGILSLVLLATGQCFAQVPNAVPRGPFPISRAQMPVPPPGFPQGPFTSFNLRASEKGQVIAKLGSKARNKISKRFQKKYGQAPSSHQILQQFAKQLGLRASEPISDDTLLLKGRRVNEGKINRARKKKLVGAVEINYKTFAFGTANDLFFNLGLLWGMNNTGGFFGGEPDVDIDAPEAWDLTDGNPTLVVGVIDTGVLLTHPDLTANIWTNPLETPDNGIDDDGNGYIDDVHGWDFVGDDNDPTDDHFHGTHVAGTIAAERNNGTGVVGVAPRVKILPLKVLDANGAGDTAGLVKAVDYATRLANHGVNIRVLNASLGGGGQSPAMIEALTKANKAGILFVAAAGNDSSDNDAEPVYPASYDLPNIISVAAITNTGELASFSNYGAKNVHVAAPGDGIWSSIVFNFYLPFSGTSMASPHVAGVAALVFSANPGLGPSKVRDRIMNSVKPLPNLNGKVRAPGVVSALYALRQ